MRTVRNTVSTRWKEYSKAVKEMLILSCNIPGEVPERNVNVHYAVPSVAFAKIITPIINGSNLNPTITFYLATEALTEHQGGQDFIFRLWTGRGTTINYPHPIVKELRYRVTLFAKNMEEVNTILSQVEIMAPKGYPFHLLVNNQPTDIYVDSNFSMESNLMPGAAADRVLQYGFDIVVPRAYINYVKEVPADIIREVQIETNVE